MSICAGAFIGVAVWWLGSIVWIVVGTLIEHLTDPETWRRP